MPKATVCVLAGAEVDVEEALQLRDAARNEGRPKLSFRCGICQESVKPHKAGGQAAAHFEHSVRNPECPQSDPPR